MIEQAGALWLMLFVGAFGIPVFADSEHKAIRIAAAVWVALWWLPPLAMLWIRGVFG